MKNLEGRGPFGGKHGGQSLKDIAAKTEGGEKDRNDTQDQGDGKKVLRVNGDAFSEYNQEAEQDYRGVRQKNLAEPNVVARDGVMKSESEVIPEKVSHDKGKGGGVCPKDRDVSEGEKPSAEKAVVIAEYFFRVGESSPRVGVFFHHRVVVPPYDHHHERTDKKTDKGSDGTRDGEKRRPRHYEGSPAHGASEGERPRAQG